MNAKQFVHYVRHQKIWLSIVILSEAKNLVFVFEWKGKIPRLTDGGQVRRSDLQNDIDVRFFRCLYDK